MARLARISISLEADLLRRFDGHAAGEGFPTRSEAIKTLIHRRLAEREWIGGGELAGAVTLVYDHHRREIVSRLIDIQHDFGGLVVSLQHVHLDHRNCFEILVVKGRARKIQELLRAIKSLKGVKQAQLVVAGTGG